jgi:hypothetical protein
MKRTKARINGEMVDVEIMEPEYEEIDSSDDEDKPFILNPRVQETALFVSGVGLGLYKGVKNMLGYIPNPTGERLQRALPWALLSGLSFFLAPSLGKAKNVARVAGAGCAVKAVYEYIKKVPVNSTKKQETEVKMLEEGK